ncbi:MAG: dienelactone hydrolase family protein [Phycisphaerae bacterium]
MQTDLAKRRRLLCSLLGDLPARDGRISCKTVSSERLEHYILEKLLLDLNGVEDVPAYFVRPPEGDGPMPAVLFNHSHGGNYQQGKEEMLHSSGCLQTPAYAVELTRRGWCGLCIDHWCFGERRGRTETETFKEMLWKGQVLWGMMVFDSLRAIDYLSSRKDVDSSRLATLGLSMGSTMAWWTAALDERIKVCVDICCQTDFQTAIDERLLDGHGIYYFVPNLLKHFSTADINSLIAPRPHLALAGNYDRLTPPRGLDRIDAQLRKAYKAAGAPEAWKMLRYNVGHMETAAMRAEIVAFLEEWL